MDHEQKIAREGVSVFLRLLLSLLSVGCLFLALRVHLITTIHAAPSEINFSMSALFGMGDFFLFFSRVFRSTAFNNTLENARYPVSERETNNDVYEDEESQSNRTVRGVQVLMV